jgi:uncharacterized protein (DUF433 family)
MSTALATPPTADTRLDAVLQRLDRLEQAVSRLAGLLEQTHAPLPWKYLERRPDKWHRQLYVKGRNMTARQLAGGVLVNKKTPEEGARDYDLPVEAVREALAYIEKDKDLIAYEALYEKHLLEKAGYSLDTPTLPR